MTKTNLIPPDILLNAYANGAFPMAPSRHDDDIHWYQPDIRGILPLNTFHVGRSLRKFIKKCPYTVTLDRDFRGVMERCADTPHTTAKFKQIHPNEAPKKGGSGRAVVVNPPQEETWISDIIIDSYTQIHHMGYAHSVEIWDGNDLVGGLYGVRLGQAFFGESMFSTQPNTSKMALVYLVAVLRYHGFELLDCQYVNDHLTQFGCTAVPQNDYITTLHHAIQDVICNDANTQQGMHNRLTAPPFTDWQNLALNI